MARKKNNPFTSDDGNAQVGDTATNLGNSTATDAEFDPVKPYEAKTDSKSGVNDRGVVEPVEMNDAHRIKTTEAARVAKSASPIVGSSALRRDVTYGGGVAAVSKDASATTKVSSSYKSGTREGKRNDAIARGIDFNYPQLIEVSRKESKPLAETSEKQGYNGNYYNQHARTQRASGGAPADPMFERSVNDILMDMLYHPGGQYNTAREDYGEYDIQSYDTTTKGYVSAVDDIGKRGSYLPDTLTVSFNQFGSVGLSVTEHDVSNRNLDEEVAQASGDAALRNANQRELDRLTILANAGDENDVNYSPLGDQIVTATAVNTYLADIEASAGDFAFMSERHLQYALAYQLNKAALDGVRLTGPMAEMVNYNIEGIHSAALGSISEATGRLECFNREAYAVGGAGLFVELHDSIGKYTTKAKLLSLPLSFRNLVQTSKQNSGVLRCHADFVRLVQKSELFSTIDTPWDPFMPVCITDKHAIHTNHSLAKSASLINYTTDTAAAANVMKPSFNVFVSTLRNKTVVPVYDFFIKGLHEYFKAYAFKFRSLLPGANNEEKTLTIPIQSSICGISAWDCLVCDAMPFIIREREKTLQFLVIKYQNAFGYPYTGLTALSQVDVTAADNFSFVDVDTPLQSQIAKPIDSIKLRMPEILWPVDASTTAYCFKNLNSDFFRVAYCVLPHYFVQNQFKQEDSGLLRLSEDSATMAYPSQRSGSTDAFMDVIYGMTEEDYRLSLDRMTVYPGYTRVNADGTWYTNDVQEAPKVVNIAKGPANDDDPDHVWNRGNNTPFVYKYGYVTDGQPVIPYLASSEDPDNSTSCLTILDVISTPREMGYISVAPAGFLTPYDESGVANFRNVSSSYLAKSGPGFTIRIWSVSGKDVQSTILGQDNVAYDPNESYTFDWKAIQAIPSSGKWDNGFVPGLPGGIKATASPHTYTLDKGSLDFVPFVYNGYNPQFVFGQGLYEQADESQVAVKPTTDPSNFSIVSFQKYMWTRFQRLPFVINPFDTNMSDLNYDATGSYIGNKFDIFDYLYYLGLAGFRASDYSQLQYERVKNRIAMGLNYVTDPYVNKSLLLK